MTGTLFGLVTEACRPTTKMFHVKQFIVRGTFFLLFFGELTII